MRLRTIGLISTLALGLLAAPLPTEAQQAGKVPRIGFVWRSQAPRVFWEALRDVGYIEGKNIVVEYRGAEGKRNRIPSLVAELVQIKVDVLVVVGLPAVRAAKQATKTIPILLQTVDLQMYPEGGDLVAGRHVVTVESDEGAGHVQGHREDRPIPRHRDAERGDSAIGYLG